jgi:hypothetical protein
MIRTSIRLTTDNGFETAAFALVGASVHHLDTSLVKKGSNVPFFSLGRPQRANLATREAQSRQFAGPFGSPLTDSNRRPLLTMEPLRQLDATDGNAFRLFEPLLPPSDLLPLATSCDHSISCCLSWLRCCYRPIPLESSDPRTTTTSSLGR